MRKFWVCMTVVMISLGFMAVMGGCGGSGGGGGGTPQSSSAYAGSSMPSVIDSTSVWSYADLVQDVRNIVDWYINPPIGPTASGGTTSDSWDFSIDGSGGGTYSEAGESIYKATDTSDGGVNTSEEYARYLWQGSFDSFLDSGDQYPWVLEGDGSFYQKQEVSVAFTSSGDIRPRQLLPNGTESRSNYVNYSGLKMRMGGQPDYLYGMDGHMDQKYDADYTADLCDTTFAADLSASKAGTPGHGAYYGLLNTNASVAYDGSDTTITGSGTVCGEGDADLLHFDGCVDFVIDAVWKNYDFCNDEGDLPVGFPDRGTYLISTINARAMYDFGDTSGCLKYLVDADNDGAYEYSTLECD